MDGLTKNIVRLSANSYFIGCVTEHKDKNQENLNSCKQKSSNFVEPIENISKQAR